MTCSIRTYLISLIFSCRAHTKNELLFHNTLALAILDLNFRLSQIKEATLIIRGTIHRSEWVPCDWDDVIYRLSSDRHRENSFLTSSILPQLVKKFPALYVTGKFITACTRSRDLLLSRARSIYSTSSQTMSWRCFLILSSNLCPGLTSAERHVDKYFMHFDKRQVRLSLIVHVCNITKPEGSD